MVMDACYTHNNVLRMHSDQHDAMDAHLLRACVMHARSQMPVNAFGNWEKYITNSSYAVVNVL